MRNGILKTVGICLVPALILLSGCGGGGGGAAGGAVGGGDALAVTSVSPSENSLGVPTDTTVSATFSAALDPATVSGAALTLHQNGISPVPGHVSYVSATRTVVFSPSAPLANGTAYTATVAPLLKDQAGRQLPAAKSWTFTTLVTGSAGGGGGF